jgi:endonuclease/exonuclease/phosphatase family metal-dependent hydrolase
MAQILSAFDVVALQEVHWKLDALHDLLGILGPEWGYFVTDVKEGVAGNMERIAILYYRPRVAFEHVSGEIVLPDESLIEGRQFARKPLLSSFRSGRFAFRICSAHVYFGGGRADARARSIRECQALADYLIWTAQREHQTIVLAGNFNMTDKDSDAVRAFTQRGFRIPPRILHPSSVRGDKYYDMIGLYEGDDPESPQPRFGSSGSINLFEHVFRSADEDVYLDEMSPSQRESRRGYERWKTRQLSDHRPVWLELRLLKPSNIH